MSRRHIELLGIPVRLWLALQEHTDAVMREYRLMTPRATPGPDDGWLAVVHQVEQTFPESTIPMLRARVQHAYDAGLDRVDLRFDATPRQVELMLRLHELLSEVDEYCAKGALLTLPLRADAIALRAWVVGEAARQMRDGGPPALWAGGDPADV